MLSVGRALTAVVLVASALVLAPAVPARADCPPPPVIGVDGTGRLVYGRCDPGGGGPGSGGGGGTGTPTCTLAGLAEYCIGASACWANVPSALDPSVWPEDTRPSPSAIYTYQSCDPDPDGTLTGWSWYEPQTLSVAEAARAAYGSLQVPAFEVGVNPPGRALVGLATWFWAQGPTSQEIVGSAALGLRAVGTPSRVEVDPGDGAATRTCGWAVSAGDGCSYTYPRASVGEAHDEDGLPAYRARMRIVYEVRFEQNGMRLDLPGLPTTIASAWVTTPVPVAEVQTLVEP